MSGKTFRRRTATLAVLALLAAAWVEPGVRGEPPRRAVTPAASWSLLLELLWTSLTGIMAKEGCTIDPSGANCPRSQSQDEGCSLDPNGACVPAAPKADNGCTIDPSGHCSK